ncbi:hypothetical protein WMF45_03075 [Sorangium sp. So ce448]|uniref:hypothetical protein n=1 Tax=Sorangium sp. So ce448 TaxID=3133314 RepID=UPI003F63C545
MRDGGAGHFGFVTTIRESLLRQAPLKRSCRSNAGAFTLGGSELSIDRGLAPFDRFVRYAFNV